MSPLPARDVLGMLVCPVCKGPLKQGNQELICLADRLAYPVREGVPVMWADAARTLSSEEWDSWH